jgi:hypothetical protein
LKTRYVFFLIILTAVFGYAQPAVNARLSFLGITRDFDFGIRTVFENNEIADSDLYELLSENEAVQDISKRIIASVSLYFGALIFFVAAAAYSFFGKMRIVKIILPATAIVLHIFSGRVILTVPEVVADTVTDILGFLARFLNAEEILTIEFAAGYWVVLVCMVAQIFCSWYTQENKSFGEGNHGL